MKRKPKTRGEKCWIITLSMNRMCSYVGKTNASTQRRAWEALGVRVPAVRRSCEEAGYRAVRATLTWEEPEK